MHARHRANGRELDLASSLLCGKEDLGAILVRPACLLRCVERWACLRV